MATNGRNNPLRFPPGRPTLRRKLQRNPPDETDRLADRHPLELPPPRRARGVFASLPEADAYAITGDIGEAHDVADHLRAFADRGPVYFVLGNHDYYRRHGTCARGCGWLHSGNRLTFARWPGPKPPRRPSPGTSISNNSIPCSPRSGSTRVEVQDDGGHPRAISAEMDACSTTRTELAMARRTCARFRCHCSMPHSAAMAPPTRKNSPKPCRWFTVGRRGTARFGRPASRGTRAWSAGCVSYPPPTRSRRSALAHSSG